MGSAITASPRSATVMEQVTRGRAVSQLTSRPSASSSTGCTNTGDALSGRRKAPRRAPRNPTGKRDGFQATPSRNG